MTKVQIIAEKVAITFAEAFITYLAVAPNVTLTKAGLAGALGAGLSAAYNLLRESTPSITTVSAPVVEQVTPVTPPVAPEPVPTPETVSPSTPIVVEPETPPSVG